MTFALREPAFGKTLPKIGKFLVQTQVQTTARYAHPAQNSVKIGAARIADSLEADMDTSLGRFTPPPLISSKDVAQNTVKQTGIHES